MAITLITAVPGSGKTLFGVQKIFEYLNKPVTERDPLRHVYSNIDGLQIPGVFKMPEDWRDTPDGSVIFIDEAQMMPQYKKKNAKQYEAELKQKFEDIREQLQIHRHSGHDITFITQFPRLLHTDVLDLVGEHYHLHRAFGLQAATMYFWRFAQANPNTKSAKKDTEVTKTWFYPKHLYKYYQSATVHTHKSKIPAKYLIILCIPFLLAIWVYHSFQKTPYAHGLKKDQETSATASSPNTPNSTNTSNSSDAKQQVQLLDDDITRAEQKRERELYSHNLQIINYQPMLRVAAVFVTEGRCQAYNEYSEPINMSQFDCLQASDHMTPSHNRDNDLRSNAHAGQDKQVTTDSASNNKQQQT